MPSLVQFDNTDTARIGIRSKTLPSPARIRILHVVSRLTLGGTEHGMLKVVNGLGEDQFEHRLCAVRGVDPEFANRMGVLSKAYSVGDPKPGFQFPLFRLIRLMKTLRPHIVHTRNFGALEAIPAARIAGVPVAIHSEHGYEIETISGLPLRRRLLCRAIFPMADALFAVTKDLVAYHSTQSWISADKFRVLYNGVNTDKFSPRRREANRIKRERGIPEGRTVIGSVGRLVPIKDHGTLLNAAELLVNEGVNIHVLIVGGGPELGRLQSRVEDSTALRGRVTFCGASGNVPELLNAMDVFVLCSVCEGMSNTILEAMASGLPIVATRAGGNPELVVDGQCGWLFAPRDVPALVQHLKRLIDEPQLRQRFGTAARLRAAAEFDLNSMVKNYHDLYFELAARRGVLESK